MARQLLITLPLVILLTHLGAQNTRGQFYCMSNGEIVNSEGQTTCPNLIISHLSTRYTSKKIGSNISPVRGQQMISFCDLVHNPDLYNQRVVRTEATMVIGYEQSYLYDLACNSRATWSWVESDYPYGSSSEAQKLLDNLLNQKEAQGAGRAKVTIVGRFDASPGKRYGHLDQFRSQFTIMRVERVEPVVTALPWPWEVEEVAPLSKAAQAVKNLNNDFLLYYAGARIPRLELDLFDSDLADDFIFTGTTGEVKNKPQFIELIKPLHFVGNIINDNLQAQVFGDTAVVTGRIMKAKDNVIVEQFRYTSRYVKRKGRWQVLALKVTSHLGD